MSCPRVFFMMMPIVSSYFHSYIISFRVKKQRADKPQDDLSHEILFDSNSSFPSTSCLFLRVFRETKTYKEHPWKRDKREIKQASGKWMKLTECSCLSEPRSRTQVFQNYIFLVQREELVLSTKHSPWFILIAYVRLCRFRTNLDFFTKLSVHQPV